MHLVHHPGILVNPKVLGSITGAEQNTTFVPGRGPNLTLKDLPMDEETPEELGQALLTVRNQQG